MEEVLEQMICLVFGNLRTETAGRGRSWMWVL